jgi:hypothetical protein
MPGGTLSVARQNCREPGDDRRLPAANHAFMARARAPGLPTSGLPLYHVTRSHKHGSGIWVEFDHRALCGEAPTRTSQPAPTYYYELVAVFFHLFHGRIETMVSRRVRVSGLIPALALSALASVAGSSPDETRAPVDEKQWESWWSDLEKGDTPATRALLELADRPKDAVTFLARKLKPLTISSAQVKTLLLKLGNANEAVWKPAFDELDYLDPRLAIDLETLMDRYTEYPLRQRLVELLSGRDADALKDRTELTLRKTGTGFNFTGKTARGGGSWWAEHRVDRINSDDPRRDTKKKWTRAVRAIVLLEHIRTPEAVAILKAMAGGDPDAYPTKVAREALAAIGEKSARATFKTAP